MKVPWIAPVTTEVAACPEPRYGTSWILVPAAALSWFSAITGELAGPDVPKLYFSRIGLGARHQLRDRFVRQLGIDHQHQRRAFHDLADVGEILDRVVRHLDVMEILRVGDRIGVQRVAVRLRSQNVRGADRARPAGLVLDHHRNTQLLLQNRGKEACRHVGQAALRKRHHDDDGAVGVILRVCG